MSAETKAEQGTTADATTSRQPIAKPDVGCGEVSKEDEKEFKVCTIIYSDDNHPSIPSNFAAFITQEENDELFRIVKKLLANGVRPHIRTEYTVYKSFSDYKLSTA